MRQSMIAIEATTKRGHRGCFCLSLPGTYKPLTFSPLKISQVLGRGML